jgi:hypothetical protein
MCTSMDRRRWRRNVGSAFSVHKRRRFDWMVWILELHPRGASTRSPAKSPRAAPALGLLTAAPVSLNAPVLLREPNTLHDKLG